MRVAELGPPVIGRAPSNVRAGVAELVDALDLGSSIERCGGSSPFARTITPRTPNSGREKSVIVVKRDRVLADARQARVIRAGSG